MEKRNYNFAIQNWNASSKNYNKAKDYMIESVKNMIHSLYNELCPNGDDDYGLMDISASKIKLRQYDADSIIINNKNEIFILMKDENGYELEINIDDFDNEEIYKIGESFIKNVQDIKQEIIDNIIVI